MRISEKAFDRIVKRALGRIPDEIRRHLDNVIVSVRRRPTRDMLRSVGMEQGDEILGLFQGVPLIERSITSPPLFPDTIFLFQGPLEEMCETESELAEQIEITVVHEIAHYVGMDEERLAELGYA
ncbi:MAG: metallopeptidase family protein [Syntrophorhabdales bacterium]|jgi:predicted Zn-dependent protease with MMP-like domain